MNDQLELVELKKQIDNLQSIVNRLEKGESKYVTPERKFVKGRSALFTKYFGTHEEIQKALNIDTSTAWHFEEAMKRGIHTTADALYRIKYKVPSNRQIKTVVDDDTKLSNYLDICEQCMSGAAINLFDKKEENI